MKPLLNSQGQPLYVLIRLSDGFVINSRAISNTTGLPNPGPGQKYLPILKEDAPDNDTVYTIVTTVEAPDNADPLLATEWHIKYDVKDRPLAERLAIADNAKRFELQNHVPPQDFSELTVLTLAAVLRASKGLELTAGEQARADKLVAIAAKLEANATNAEDIKAAITAGQKPDLKAGWAAASIAP